jgi:hypothetical protein
MAKLKDLIKENFSILGGVVSTPAIGNHKHRGLSDIVEDIYGTSDKVSAKEIKEAMSTFSKLGKVLHREENLKEIANSLSEIANKAKTYTLSETDDWFDKVTVNRNMKELTTLSKSFGKFAQEAHGLQERMSALYEDMGHIVGRYYEVNDEDKQDDETCEGSSIEEGDYEAFFKAAMKKFGVSSPDELDDEAKSKFFNYVDANFKGKSEGRVMEGKWAVTFELGGGVGDATIIIDAQGAGQAKSLVAKQLKKGLSAVTATKRVQSAFASQMDKKLGDD